MSNPNTENLVRLDRPQPRLIPASEHRMPTAGIGDNALKVLRRLRDAGYQAYLVGGCVRDLLLNLRPKDFDVVTDAHPEQVRKLFRNCILIGRRFRLAHVRFGREIIEVSTFRAPHQQGEDGIVREGRIIRDNVYGDMNGDAWRRDFTINALFYDAVDGSLVDYTDGWEDLQARCLRLIGEPRQRYQEDPVRMLRAVRFAAKLNFKIAPSSATWIKKEASWLNEVPTARLFDEFIKLFLSGYATSVWKLLHEHCLTERLFPGVEAVLREHPTGSDAKLLRLVMEDTDRRVAADLPVTPIFLIAALLWPELRLETARTKKQSREEEPGREQRREQLAADAVLARQVPYLAIPRRFSIVVRELWQLQSPLQRYAGGSAQRRAEKLRSKARFRAAYDLLLLRARAGEPVQQEANWWTELQEREPPVAVKRHAPPGTAKATAPRRRRRRRAPR